LIFLILISKILNREYVRLKRLERVKELIDEEELELTDDVMHIKKDKKNYF